MLNTLWNLLTKYLIVIPLVNCLDRHNAKADSYLVLAQGAQRCLDGAEFLDRMDQYRKAYNHAFEKYDYHQSRAEWAANKLNNNKRIMENNGYGVHPKYKSPNAV